MSKRYRIALSYAGEQRPFVAEVARLLAERFGQAQILYDRFHRAEFARGDLALRLPELYRDESDLVVVVLCPQYEGKDWCGLEWNAVYSLLMKRRTQDVMLTRFRLVDARGLHGLAGFVDLDDMKPAELAQLILQRLALNKGLERDHYLAAGAAPARAGPDWPDKPPALDWPVADHTKARAAFEALVTRHSAHRLLLISGSTDTGKSHLSKQFVRNTLKIDELRVGRFDFKGSTDMDEELRSLAQRLDVNAPVAGSGASRQLAQIFNELRAGARPTLLIFDTFEAAGEAERWVRENLLLALVRAPWLRVVILGQRVPRAHGEPWADAAAPPIELSSPSPQEWYEFGRQHREGLTLELVERVHELARGHGGTLAQLLGPGEG
jgi:hypothetical protein